MLLLKRPAPEPQEAKLPRFCSKPCTAPHKVPGWQLLPPMHCCRCCCRGCPACGCVVPCAWPLLCRLLLVLCLRDTLPAAVAMPVCCWLCDAAAAVGVLVPSSASDTASSSRANGYDCSSSKHRANQQQDCVRQQSMYTPSSVGNVP
jgi:hypothetical protein